jgi:DNA helicase-2/ATP-dependent DNA helicase PcrA
MFRYFGPPGTGKTTTLLNHVEELLSGGTPPTQIGYFAFTRKAAHEARDRAVARFGLNPDKDFIFFRTLHSLAFQLLGLSGAGVLKETHLKEFSSIVGVNLTESVEAVEDEGFLTFRSNHPIMRAIDLARTTDHGPQWAYNRMNLLETSYHFKHIFSEYEKFKRKNGLKDFTDMLVDLSENEALIPELKVVFLDEAQDLTPLQWKVAHLINNKCERMYVAGDDDQGIFGWAGADINRFIGLAGASEVLTQSHRIPRSVWKIADRVSSRIRRRQKKEWSPRDADGSTRFVHDHYGIDFTDQWLILAQANYMLNEIGAYLKTSGYFFERFNTPSLSKKIRSAISSWTYLTTGQNREISLSEAQNLYAHISSEDGRLQRGAKTLLKSANEQDVFTLGLLHEHFGLEATGTWDQVLDRIKSEDRAYASTLLNRGVNLNSKPKIRLSTIHGAKGGEADNVYLMLDLSGKALEEMTKNPDDGYRVLYTGITRTKENLVLKMPEDWQRGWML